MKFSGDKVISQETAYQMTSILQGVIKKRDREKAKRFEGATRRENWNY